MNDWLAPLADLVDRGGEGILLSVVAASGSTPREVGAKMLVTDAQTFATIGGGQFEYQCVERARDMLACGEVFDAERFDLGPDLGQCCGGVVSVCFDRVGLTSAWVTDLHELVKVKQAHVLASLVSGPPGDGGNVRKLIATTDKSYGGTGNAGLDQLLVRACREMLHGQEPAVSRMFDVDGREVTVLLEPAYPTGFNIELFGAGHVGRALVQVLGTLGCSVRWVDSRKDIFPLNVPANVECIRLSPPEHAVDAAPVGAYYLVLTHAHPLDLRICERVLKRNDFRYCGLIGSRSKRIKFDKRFQAAGIPEHTIQKLVCPIGIDGLSGKHPAQIAVSVAAQLLQIQESGRSRENLPTGIFLQSGRVALTPALSR
jgi:xanthine dehydrogenase accessory factor